MLSRPVFWSLASVWVLAGLAVVTLLGIIGQAVLGATALVLLASPLLLDSCCKQNASAVSEHGAALESASGSALAVAVEDDGAAKPPRLLFLDNLKTSFTAIVVLFHTTCAFSGAGFYYNIGYYYTSFQPAAQTILLLFQCFFMSIFFFISGYFTPTSLERKGRAGFLVEKLKRLGIPLLLFTFLLGPALEAFEMWSVAPGALPFYWPFYSFGPCWYILWLLVFSAAACLHGGAPLVAPRPPLAKAVGLGLGLGALQGLVALLRPGGGFLAMPLGQSSLLFYIAFFSAGVVAKRNGWLAEPLPPTQLRWALGLSLAIVLLTLALFVGLCARYSAPYNAASAAALANSTAPAGPYAAYGLPLGGDINAVPSSGSPAIDVAYSLVLCVTMGAACMIFTYATFGVFRARANVETPRTKAFASAAYTVYLIHPWVLTPLTIAYVAVLSAAGIDASLDPDMLATMGFSSPKQIGDGYIWLGWFVVGLLTQLCVWPLAYAVRSLPGLRLIL